MNSITVLFCLHFYKHNTLTASSDRVIPVWTGWPVVRLWPAAGGYWEDWGAGSTRPGSRRWWSDCPGTEAEPGPPRPRSPADSPAPFSEPEDSGRPPSPEEPQLLTNSEGREQRHEGGHTNDNMCDARRAQRLLVGLYDYIKDVWCYRGGSAILWVAAGLRAGVITQTITLLSHEGLVATGGSHCALHLVLHVPGAALRAEDKEDTLMERKCLL